MTGRRRLAVVLLGAALLTTGCPVAPDRSTELSPSPTSGRVLPALPTTASIGLPQYEGPPAGAPASVGPLTTVRGVVDLTPATPGVFARAVAAVASADG